MIKILVIIWTMVAVILNLCEIGTFAKWDITALPWHWSCLCIFYWWLFVYIVCVCIVAWRRVKAQQAWDESPAWVKHFTKRPE